MAEIKDKDELQSELVESAEQFAAVDYSEQFAAADEDDESNVPAGYITIELSTKGYLYAPKRFHVKNFTAEDLLDLSFVDDEQLPRRIIGMFDKLILEDNVTIADFHEAEVTEFLVQFFSSFYSPILKDQDYILDDKDWKFLADRHGGEESADYKKYKADIESKRWTPKFSIDLRTLKSYDIDENFKYTAKVKKASGFTCKYSLPRYGDVVKLQNYVEKIFKEKDKQFEAVARMIKFRQEAEEKIMNGDTKININSIPTVPKAEVEKFNEYQKEKTVFIMIATRALHLEEYKGVDVRGLSLDEKFKLAQDPELDYPTFKAISDKFKDIKVGLVKEVNILDPIMNQYRDYEYTFQLNDLFQAIRNADVDGTTVEFE